MFTGIIKALGTVSNVSSQGSNITFTITSPISHTFSVDESIAHNGVCLTITSVTGDSHTVTAIHETLAKTNLGQWAPGTIINLEPAMQFNGRLDGHLVQGHADSTATCANIINHHGSTEFVFNFSPEFNALVIEKGSICINGTSLTLVGVSDGSFSVHIIPYTLQHTNFNTLKTGDSVNIEFDILGKYIHRYMQVMAR